MANADGQVGYVGMEDSPHLHSDGPIALLPRGRGRVWLGSLSCREGLPGHRGHISALQGDSRMNTTAAGVGSGREQRGDSTGTCLLLELQQRVNPLQRPQTTTAVAVAT